MATWEEVYVAWARSPSKTEQEKIENAEGAVRNAIRASVPLSKHTIVISTQGSYKNRTNVKQDSDIDIGVTCTDVLFTELPEGLQQGSIGLEDSTYTHQQFKSEVHAALTSHFGSASVSRGNKALTVRENSYHVSADVAPFFVHRRYESVSKFHTGYELRPDNAPLRRIVNWHDQHFANGQWKNTQTNRRYRSLVRILKSLRNYMEEQHTLAANNIPGFLIECLVWNVPNNYFGNPTFSADVRECLAFLFNKTLTDADCKDWGEVSELNYLFHTFQKWTRSQAHAFIAAAWNFLGLE